jgi:hypothetical protein
MEMTSTTRVKVDGVGATMDLSTSLDRDHGPSITRDSLGSLPRSEQVEITKELTIQFAQLVQQMGLPLSVIGESMQNTGSLSKAVGKRDSNWQGDSLIQMRRDERKEMVIQREAEAKKARDQAKARR